MKFEKTSLLFSPYVYLMLWDPSKLAKWNGYRHDYLQNKPSFFMEQQVPILLIL